jgi:mannose-1-phosphate guanylyltransferase/mannose-6-phosphate isomerase
MVNSCVGAAVRPISCRAYADSGPAVALAAVLAAERDRDALVLVLDADHVIRNTEKFYEACRQAAVAAASGRIVTFGIEPTWAAKNYGYIRLGAKLNRAAVCAVEAFVEKPDGAMAARYVTERYLWTAGTSSSCRDHAARG